MRYLVFLLMSIALLVHPAIAATNSWVDATNFANSIADGFGWVCDPSTPTKTFDVKLYSDGAYIATVHADRQGGARLSPYCGRNVNHTYVYHYPPAVLDGNPHQISAFINYNGTYVQLSNSPITVQYNSTRSPKGWFDYVTSDYAWGWACDATITNPKSPRIIVSFYNEDGNLIGTTIPKLNRPEPTFILASGCGTSYRAFQFSFPVTMNSDGLTHTVFAVTSNADGTGRQIIGGGPITFQFFSTPKVTYAAQPATTSAAQVDRIAGANVYTAQGGGGTFSGGFYCYGTNTNNAYYSIISGLTGLAIPSPVSTYQRGPANIIGTTAVQAYGGSLGVFINGQDAGVDPACSGLAGKSAGFSWAWAGLPGAIPPYAPVPWPSGSQSDMKKELIISLNIKVPYAAPGGGVAYTHGTLFFRDMNNNKRLWIDPQLFDTRTSILAEQLDSNGSSPILITSFGTSGSYGRAVSGQFTSATFNSARYFEHRINGYQFENALLAAGCSTTDSTKLSCHAYDYQLTIASELIETYQGGKIGVSFTGLSIRRTQ